MALGTSLFLIAVGAILAYAVNGTLLGIDWLDVNTVGIILMVVGVLGLVLSFIFANPFSSGNRSQPPPQQPPPPRR